MRTRPGPAPALVEHHSAPPIALAGRRTPSKGTFAGPARVVALHRRAHESIRSKIDSDGDEHGGWLVGEHDSDRILIVDASDAGYLADRGRHFVRLQWEAGERLETHRRERGLDVRVCGTWHTHGDGGRAAPSPGDLDTLPYALGLTRDNTWVDVIGCYPNSWTPYADWAAYVAHRGQRGEVVCRPARLEIGESWL